MSGARPLPWVPLVEALGEAAFEGIRAAAAENGVDALDRDAFLLLGPVGAVLREMVPEDAPAEAVAHYGALLHALFALRDAGWPVREVERATLEAALASPPGGPVEGAGAAVYLRLPERLFWAEPAPGAAHEPLDGCVLLTRPGAVSVLAVLGCRPDREGFTTMEANGTLPVEPPDARADGGPPFASVLPAGERAGLRSLVTAPELLALALAALAASGTGS